MSRNYFGSKPISRDERRVVLITGSRKGIGKSLVEHYSSKGFEVIGCSRQPAHFEGIEYQHFSLDIANEVEVLQMFSVIRKKYDRLDILINNAGIAATNHVMMTSITAVQRLLDTNVVGNFLFCREAAKIMATRKWGRIVNFVSTATPLRLEGEAIYAASKAAVISLTQIMARELAPYNITVNAVGPTPVATDFIQGIAKEKIQEIVKRQAIPRLGEFADVLNVIDFFIRPESSFITGQTLFLGGVS
jgi:3-oxoacyl-[acyl-carrier protein] reductase